MENNETTKEAALRETEEEAGADIVVRDLFSLMNLPTVQQIHLFYLAELKSLSLSPGLETLEAKMFTEVDIPWNEIAFTSTRQALELFFLDQVRALSGQSRLHAIDLKRLVYPV